MVGHGVYKLNIQIKILIVFKSFLFTPETHLVGLLATSIVKKKSTHSQITLIAKHHKLPLSVFQVHPQGPIVFSNTG